jgi:RNA polymerase sigma factor (sigma-70 family)
MASGTLGATLRHLRDLFGDGTAVGLGDGQLLAWYAASGDEAAFEALVARHGPMVLATCRGILRHEPDIEDAFQATFLVLARKAGSVRGGDALGGWLHRVAYRAAVQASIAAARRRRHEAEAAAMATLSTIEPEPPAEIASIVHEELDRLPDRHRLPVVLCDLEGLTYQQAAGRLRWTEPTLRHRLLQGRSRLRERLTRRGVTAGAMGLILASPDARAEVPAALARSAISVATGSATTATAAAISAAIIRGMAVARWKLAAPALLAAAALATAVGPWRGHPHRAAMPVQAVGDAPATATSPAETIAIRGRVVDPAGKPVAGAALRLAYADPVGPTAAASGPDGRFVLQVPRSVRSAPTLLNGYDDFPWLVATAPGFGPGRVRGALQATDAAEVTVRLAVDGPPIEGRIVDLEGRSVAGARVEAARLYPAPGDNLERWLRENQGRRGAARLQGLEWLPLSSATTTDRDGRFRLAGCGRAWIAQLAISGPGIATTTVNVMSRDSGEIREGDATQVPTRHFVIHPRQFTSAVAPTKSVEGVVRDRDTGRPLAGLTLHAAVAEPGSLAPTGGVEAVTDDQGRYRLVGLPRAAAYQVAVEPAEGKPYPRTAFRVKGDSPAFDPVRFDISLKRGVPIRGRVTDKVTGRPAPGYIDIYTFRDNPAIKEFPGYGTYNNLAASYIQADGRFEAIGLPGRNVVACRSEMRRYRGPLGTETIPGYDPRRMALDTLPLNCYINNYHFLAVVDIKSGAESATLDLQLDPGRSLTLDVVDPDGRPVGGTKVKGVTDLFWDALEYEQPSPKIEVHALDTSKPRRVLITRAARQLIAAAYLKGDEAGPLTIRLQPWGEITGRIVDDEGQPRPGLELNNLGGTYPPPPAARGILPGGVQTNSVGRYRIRGLVPGLKYSAAVHGRTAPSGPVFRDVTVAPGEVKDLGDLKVVPPGRGD